MSSPTSAKIWSALRAWRRDYSKEHGGAATAATLVRNLWSFVLESTPAQGRQRYGDMDYDWEHRVNTTSGTTNWRTRLLGVFHSPYQPTEPALFHEMMTSLPIRFEDYTFLDLGSGKGRPLLMASDYPFRRILGVELLEELHRVAEENIRDYRSPTQRCTTIESILADARDFKLPKESLVLYLFNPLPESALLEVLQHLQKSLADDARPVWIVYHNPVLETTLGTAGFLEKVEGTLQFSLYRAICRGESIQ